ncbi:hypothetical protein ACJX0J_037899, partial [Zea mays]
SLLPSHSSTYYAFSSRTLTSSDYLNKQKQTNMVVSKHHWFLAMTQVKSLEKKREYVWLPDPRRKPRARKTKHKVLGIDQSTTHRASHHLAFCCPIGRMIVNTWLQSRKQQTKNITSTIISLLGPSLKRVMEVRLLQIMLSRILKCSEESTTARQEQENLQQQDNSLWKQADKPQVLRNRNILFQID